MFYTYYIKAENKYYFGSRTNKVNLKRAAKDDFMIHYFTSTTDKRLREIIDKGEYEKAEIIKEYTDRQECLKDEERLIKLFWAFYGKLNCWNHKADERWSTAGVSSWNKGKQQSEEAKRKNSEAHKGKPKSEEARKNMSKAHKGKPSSHKGKHHSEATKLQISEALKGENHPMYGKHHSGTTIEKLRKPQKKFYWLTPEGEIKTMPKGNALQHHPDWTLIGPVEINENN